MSKITESTAIKDFSMPVTVCDKEGAEKRSIDTLIELIVSGFEDRAIEMINESRRVSRGMTNCYPLEMESDDNGVNALMWALFHGRDSVVSALVPISNLSTISHDNMSPIACACLTGNLKHVKLLYRYMDKRGRDLFFHSNNNGNTPLDYLLCHLESSREKISEGVKC